MNKLFKFKTMRRILLFMALVFPVVYLCGGLFFALNGAHGTIDWHENTLVTPKTYNEAMQPESFSYDDWNWTNEHGTRVGFSLGFLVSYDPEYYVPDAYYYMLPTGVGLELFDDNDYDNRGLGFSGGMPNSDYIVLSWSSPTLSFSVDEYEGDIYSCMYSLTSDRSGATVFVFFPSEYLMFQCTSATDWVKYTCEYGEENDFQQSNYDYFYFDDGSMVDSFKPLTDEMVSYLRPSLKQVESDSLSDYIFSSPFASNNFVSTVGRDVMDGTADGFAPMNDLFKFVNDDVLHFDEDDSLAVFGFGYLYYAVNVIVIYEVVVIALKLLLLPLKVVDKLEVEKDV